MPAGSYRILPASEAATQPLPSYLSLNYANLFKIQRVSNPFPLRPISFSRLTSYLECPSCALEQSRKRRPKEPGRFIPVHQSSLFATKEPDPRLIGTLLHAVIDLLHDAQGPLTDEQQALLLTDPDVLTRFLQYDLLEALQTAGKFKLAVFVDELKTHRELLRSSLLRPLILYQREYQRTGSTVFAASERFQCKLLSTGKTFVGHKDWGGYVGLVGEFDQIRLRKDAGGRIRPAIMEFKKGLGKARNWDISLTALENLNGASNEPGAASELEEPGLAHAFQLMIYWLAFQTRWDVMEQVMATRGQMDDLAMSFQQELDLILFNLHDGCQYQLVPTDIQTALLAVTHCVFYLNWAMKSGYALQAPEHDCGKTQLLSKVPSPLIQVGNSSLPAETCYTLARAAFHSFSETVRWQKVSVP